MIGADFGMPPLRLCSRLLLIFLGVDASFTDWLFAEAAKGAAGPDIVPQSPPIKADASDPGPSRDPPPHIPNDSSRKALGASRSGVYQHAISQAFPPPTSQKRTSSARSPSPSHPNKSRRTDLPTGPRAMLRDGPSNSTTNPQPNARSLLDRVGGPANASGRSNGSGGFGRDEIQARIDNIVNGSPDPNMMMAGFPAMGGMDMNVMAAANMANPIMLQEMMMNQMALMAQMASSMGIINPNTGQFGGQGFPVQSGMPGDMGMFQNGTNTGFHGHQMGGNMNNSGMNGSARGRGTGRSGRGVGRGRGGADIGALTHSSVAQEAAEPPSSESIAPEPPVIATPAPTNPAPVAGPPAATPVAVGIPVPPQRLAYAIPERPQSPTLCKFGLKCTNAHCRYSHPSPVATAESGVVLSNDPCEKGRDCKDKDCIRAHVSPAVLNPQGALFSLLKTRALTDQSRRSRDIRTNIQYYVFSPSSLQSDTMSFRSGLYPTWLHILSSSTRHAKHSPGYSVPLRRRLHACSMPLPTS